MIRVRRKNTYIAFIVVGVLAILGITLASAFRVGKSTDVNVYPVTLDANIDLTEDLQDVIFGDTIVNGVSFSRTADSDDIYVRADLRYVATGTISDEDRRFLLAINYDDVTTFAGTTYKWVRAEDGYYYLTDLNGAPLKVTDSTSYTFCTDLTYQGAKCINNDVPAPATLTLNAELQAIHARDVDSITLTDLSTLFNANFGTSPALGYIVAFDTDDAGFVPAQTFLNNGLTVTIPPEPTKMGYEFTGWYTDPEFTNEYNFETIVDKSFTLYAEFYAPRIEIIENGNVINQFQNHDYTLRELIESNPELQNKYNFYNDEAFTDNITLDEILTDEHKIYVEPVTTGLRYSVSNSNTYTAKVDGYSTVSDTDVVIADNWTNNGVVYTVSTISGNAFQDKTAITSVKIPNTITSIGALAFYDCSGLTSLIIGEGVTSIGDTAFSGCTGLTSIEFNATSCRDLDSGGSTFANAGVESVGITVNIGANVTKIPGYIFGSIYNNAPNITGITFEDGSMCESIGANAFYYCESLTGELVLPNSVTNIGIYAFSYCSNLTGDLVIPDSVVTISTNAFYGCGGLTGLVIGDSVENIYNSAFSYCDNINSVVIGQNVSNIASKAFEGCYRLVQVINNSSLTITKGVTTNGYVGYYAIEIAKGEQSVEGTFETDAQYDLYVYKGDKYLLGTKVTSLTALNDLPNVDVINQYAFFGRLLLTSITIPASVTSIGENAFQSCFRLVQVINNSSSFTITKGATTNGRVGYYAIEIVNSGGSVTGSFDDNSQYHIFNFDGLRYLVGPKDFSVPTVNDLPNNIDIINQYAFYNCSQLTSVTIPNSVTSIEYSAFYYCINITSLSLSNNIQTIGNYAFNSCRSLTSLTIPSSVTHIGQYAFSSCSALTIVTFNDKDGWYTTTSSDYTGGTSITLSTDENNATWLKNTYSRYYWYKN